MQKLGKCRTKFLIYFDLPAQKTRDHPLSSNHKGIVVSVLTTRVAPTSEKVNIRIIALLVDINLKLDNPIYIYFVAISSHVNFVSLGIPGCIIPYESSLTSIQNSSIKLLTTVMCLQHNIIFIDLFHDNCSIPSQKLLDVFLYLSHTDPSTVEKTCILSSSFIKYYLKRSSFSYHLDSLPSPLTHILESFLLLMQSPNGFLVRASCIAMKNCLPELILYCYGSALLNIVIQFLDVRNHSFWLVRVELCNLLSVIDWGYLALLSSETQLPEVISLIYYQSNILISYCILPTCMMYCIV